MKSSKWWQMANNMFVFLYRLPCSFISQALLGSYAVQSQIGDYDEDEHDPSIDYLKGIPIVPNQAEEVLEKVVELHKTHR